MKRRIYTIMALAALALPRAIAAPESVVILHTNDTHSQIDPDRQKHTGGVLRRMALVDSVRRAEPNVLLVDAGDAVQGTLYFTLFGGEVEQKSLNMLGYDVQILGNHEFDNGLGALAHNYSKAIPTVVSTNYDFTGTPMEGLTVPYVVKQTGNRRIGFVGANIDPDGLISPPNYAGIRYNDEVEAINKAAAWLRDSAMVDAVVAVSHIGYFHDPGEGGHTDPELARLCPEVDVVIGGHSHTALAPDDPRTRVVRAPGDTVLVVQNGKGGHYVGKVTLTFDSAPGTPGARPSAKWDRLAVDGRLDGAINPQAALALDPYRAAVDSVYAIKVARTVGPFDREAMMNFTADAVMRRGKELMRGGRVDMALANKGGIRRDFDAGDLSRGDIIDVYPFDNRVVVLDVPGRRLRDLFDLLARQGGQAVSSNVRYTVSPDGNGCAEVIVNGRAIDPKRTYRVATIDYLADGGDSMSQLKECKRMAQSNNVLYNDIISDLGHRKGALVPDSTKRMK